jgi:hemoglobin-like flavoprotein
MTQDDIVLVQQSWRKALVRKDSVANAFYLKLFEFDPAMEVIFEKDMRDSGRKLVHLISAVVRGLDRIEFLLPAVRDFGRRQAAVGIREEHYGAVATALLWSLEQTLEEDFTADVKAAWIVTYGVLSQTMRAREEIAVEEYATR